MAFSDPAFEARRNALLGTKTTSVSKTNTVSKSKFSDPVFEARRKQVLSTPTPKPPATKKVATVTKPKPNLIQQANTVANQAINSTIKLSKEPIVGKALKVASDVINEGKKIVEQKPVKTALQIYKNITSANLRAIDKTYGISDKAKLLEKVGGETGKILQKTPNLDLGTKGQKFFKATDTETKVVNFISNFPSAIAQGYGQDIEAIYTPKGREKLKQDALNLPKTMSEVQTAIDKKDWQKALELATSNSAITVGLDVAGLIPIGLLGKVKNLVKNRKLAQEVVEETLQEAEKQIAKKELKVVTGTELGFKEEGKKIVDKSPTPKVKPNVVNPPLSDIGDELRRFISEPGSSDITPYTGVEKLVRKSGNIEKLQGENGSFRYLYRDDKGNIVGALQGVSGKGRNVASNIYVSPELRRQGIATKILEQAKRDYKGLEVADTQTEAGKAFFTRAGQAEATTGQVRSLQQQPNNTASVVSKENLASDSIIPQSPSLPQSGGKVKPKEVKVPVKQGQSRVFQRLQQENPEQLKGDLPYDKAVLETEFNKAANRIVKDKQDAFDVAMGRKQVNDIESVATNIEMAERALKDGNNTLYEKLVRKRSIDQTRRGQAIVAEKASIEDNSTARYVKDLISTRLDKLGRKYLSGLKEGSTIKKRATEIIDGKVGQLEIKIKRGKLDTKTALKLLDELACV